jgi:glycine/D-amino acid oxidase-like deaminating enzyme
MPVGASAIVVGAGIVGSAIAFELTRAGAAVTLLDRGPVAELGASRWGFGGVSWASATTPATIAFADRGFARYHDLQAELGPALAFRPNETLVLLEDGAALARAETLVEGFRARGHGARLVSPAELKRLEPGLEVWKWAGAMALRQAHLDLRQCARTWVESVRTLGLTVHQEVEVYALEGDGSSLATSLGLLAADAVFVATGAWTRPLLRTAGIDLPAFHSHAEFLYSEPVPPALGHQVTWGAVRRLSAESAAVAEPLLPAWRSGSEEELVPSAREIGLVQFADGHVRIGQISRLVPGFRATPAPESYERLLAAARELWPAVDRLPSLRLGLRQVAFSGDHLPLVGPLPGLPGAILVLPSASPTVMAPAIGEALAAYALAGRWDPLLDEWRLDRWRAGSSATPDRWAVA